MIRNYLLTLIAISFFSAITITYAVDYADQNGYTPIWAISMNQNQVISECDSGELEEKDVDWCLNYLEDLLAELKENPVISNSVNNEDTPEPEPEPEPTQQVASKEEPICGAGTILKDGMCVVDKSQTTETKSSSKGGGCLIATATYGSELAPQVQKLRELRDNQLLQTESGTAFMTTFNQFYYSFSPTIADYEREQPIFKEAVKITLTPMLSSLSIMTLADSESEVLGLGISVIALNLGIYFVSPIVVIHTIKKKF